MKKMYIFLAEGFEEAEALATVDVIRRAKMEIETVSITGNERVTSSHNITVKADALFEDVDFEEAACLILPGGMPGTRHLEAYQPLLDLLKKQHSEGRLVAAICAAPLVLGKLNLLNGEEATCYPGFEGDLKGATLSKAGVVRSHNTITACGMGVSQQFGLEIVKAFKGEDFAKELAQSFCLRNY